MAPYSSTAFAAVPPVDGQLWSELDVAHSIGTDLSATAIVTSRFGNDLPNPILTAGGLQIDYLFGSWTASATGYYVSVRNALWLPSGGLDLRN